MSSSLDLDRFDMDVPPKQISLEFDDSSQLYTSGTSHFMLKSLPTVLKKCDTDKRLGRVFLVPQYKTTNFTESAKVYKVVVSAQFMREKWNDETV